MLPPPSLVLERPQKEGEERVGQERKAHREIPVIHSNKCTLLTSQGEDNGDQGRGSNQRAKHIEKETALCLTQTVPSNQHGFYYRKLLTPSATHHPLPIPNLPSLGTLSWHTHITSR